MLKLIWIFIIAAAVSGLMTPVAIRIAPLIGAMDIPKDNRRIHKKPMPRFGGIAIFAGALAGFAYISPLTQQTRGLLVGAILILILGVADDIRGLKPKEKLAGQIICAAVAWFFTIRILGMANLFGGAYISFSVPVSFAVTVLWIVAITNTINLIDGLDGLAAGISCIACITISYTSYMTYNMKSCFILIALAGSCMGFLAWNFYPAKIFMGDAGAMLIGYLLSTVSLIGEYPTKGTTLFATITPLLILALPVFDTVFAVIRRAASHKPIMRADKGHLHHRIMAMGFGQRRTALALYSISAIMGMAGILWTIDRRLEALVLFMVGAVLIVVFMGIGIIDKNHSGNYGSIHGSPVEPPADYSSAPAFGTVRPRSNERTKGGAE